MRSRGIEVSSEIAECERLLGVLRFVIVSLTEHDDNGDHLYWSNDEGWTQIDRCDVWSHDDLMRFCLPQDGAWVTTPAKAA